MRRILLVCCALLAGCNDTLNLAPASPDSPWQIPPPAIVDTAPPAGPDTGPASARFVVPLDKDLPWPEPPANIDPNHVYSLDELIDIAERRDQATRVAWEQARQAAINVGVARAAYLPSLSAIALAGYEHAASPFPPDLVSQGFITANAEQFLPELAIRYLLFGFGSRDAAVEAAKELSFAANVGFTGAHQTLILNVARAYYTVGGVDAQLRAAEEDLASAKLLQQSAEALAARGLGTMVDVALARRGTAEARFDVAAATAAQHDAMDTLLATMDLPPETTLRIADSARQKLPRSTGETVDRIMQSALRRRPDLLADLARLRATDAEIAEARSNFYPKLSLSANVQGNIGRISVDGAPYESVAQPQAGIFLRFDWPLFQGGLLRNQLFLAQSRHAAAEDELAKGSEEALREVAIAYDQVETSLSQYDAAVALERAANVAAIAADQAYVQGVGTFTDASDAEATLVSARAALAKAHSQALIDAASLAFATGALTSSEALAPSGASP